MNVQQPPIPEGEVIEGEGIEGEDEILLQKKFPRTPLPWDSMGSEFEVEEEVIIENRPKVYSHDM